MTAFNGFRGRLARLERATATDTAAAADDARAQRWLDAVANYRPGWSIRTPEGTWHTINWQAWMGLWPQVRALVDAIEDAEHGIRRRGCKSLETLNAEYNAMLARRASP